MVNEIDEIARDCGKLALFQFFIILFLTTLFLSVVYFWGDLVAAFGYVANLYSVLIASLTEINNSN